MVKAFIWMVINFKCLFVNLNLWFCHTQTLRLNHLFDLIQLRLKSEKQPTAALS